MAKPKKILTKEQIVQAQKVTKSNRAAARNLHVSFGHYKMYARMYKDEKTGETLYDLHSNPSGKGIPKFLKIDGKEPALLDVLEGRIPVDHFTPDKIKDRIIREGLIEEKCSRCGMAEKRVLDARAPLLMHFADGNKRNYSLQNISLLCYNCYFLYIGNVFSGRQIQALEDFHQGKLVQEPTWQLDEYQIEHLKELGLYDEEEKPGQEFVVRL